MNLIGIKRKYTRIDKNKDQFGRNFYTLSLQIDNQGFIVGRDMTDKVTANWYQKQLTKAIYKLLKEVS